MKSYLAYLKLKYITGLQYRAAAYAGMATQFFFGFVYIAVYLAFYESGSGSLPMPIDKLVSYVWLNQAFFALVFMWYKDKDIMNMIKNGDVAYELCRPQDVYFMWFSKIMGERVAAATLRFLPVLVISAILPSMYRLNLSISLGRLLLFLISFFLCVILMVAIVTFYHVLVLFTLDDKGVINMLMIIADIASGLALPIPFFPKLFQIICNVLPFRYISDFPFRFYVGNISINEGLVSIGVQIIWIIILVIGGRKLTQKALNKAVIQGG